jgi:hypothetical protein
LARRNPENRERHREKEEEGDNSKESHECGSGITARSYAAVVEKQIREILDAKSRPDSEDAVRAPKSPGFSNDVTFA